ncbi:uncharacterized protein METZ01_LOCUS469178, partial [marine metagenome]
MIGKEDFSFTIQGVLNGQFMRGFTHIILIGGFCFNTVAADIQPVAKILDSRCLDCHDAETRKGGINLTKLLAADNLNEPKIAA